MVKVIINADDLGLNPVVNIAIDDAMTNHQISSSTILANSKYWSEIHKIVEKHPDCSFGIHLNLTEGNALTNSPVFRKYGIVDNDNCFTKEIKRRKSYPSELKEAVYSEWDAQIKKVVITENIRFSHIDGHHHVHAIRDLSDVLIKIIQKYNIPAVRSAYRKPAEYFLRQNYRFANPIVWVNYIKMLKWCSRIKKYTRMVSFFDSYENVCQDVRLGMRYPDGSILELMCHPGHPSYKKEFDMIINKDLDGLVDLTLFSYKDTL